MKPKSIVFCMTIAKTNEEKIMEIKVLGPGCPKCQQTEKVVKEAVAEEVLGWINK